MLNTEEACNAPSRAAPYDPGTNGSKSVTAFKFDPFLTAK